MKKLFFLFLLSISIQVFALEDGEVVHSNQLVKEAKFLLDTGKLDELYMASSVISVLKLQNPEDKEILQLDQIVNERLIEARNNGK